MPVDVPSKNALKRVINLPLLVLYGVGTMLGAGIYALIGKVAGSAGAYAPLAFIVAAVPAAFTGASFAAMAARYPKAAGAALYVLKGLKREDLSTVAAIVVVVSGSISSAVMFLSFAGYGAETFGIPNLLGLGGLTIVVGGLAIWGIRQSVIVIALVTLLEAGVLVIIVGFGLVAEPDATRTSTMPGTGFGALGVLSGSTLAFYAFIGFEDMVNTAEEVHEPERTLPIAILISLVFTTVLYGLVAYVAVQQVSPETLGESDAPMALIFAKTTGWPAAAASVVAMIAVLNGALVQVLMASRVLYGLANEGTLPQWLATVNAKTQTPVIATVLVLLLILFASVVTPMQGLAQGTSFGLLMVFAAVNLALIRTQRQALDFDGFDIPRWVPWAGLTTSLALAGIAAGTIMGGL